MTAQYMLLTGCSHNAASCPQCLDVVFVVDNSASIGPTRFESHYKRYIRDFSRQSQWNVGRGDRSYQVRA